MSVIAIAALVTVLLLSVLQFVFTQRIVREASAEVQAILELVSTSPRLELRAPDEAPTPDLSTTKYISDEPYMDDEWNSLRDELEIVPR